MRYITIIAIFITHLSACAQNFEAKVGAERVDQYQSILKGKSVGVVGNQSSLIGNMHLVDSLLQLGIDVKRVFSPEHGFRGKADAGEKVVDGVDLKTGLPIVSLYGSNKKPKPEQLEGLDILVFDIQDVGARFYTYISTLHYVMEACAEQGIPVLVLDRPNPNGHYVDGPVLEKDFKSFVGMHPIPIVHGMTIAEYAQMINGEYWLADSLVCDLLVVACENYNHQMFYDLPVKPSPNLPNALAVNLYPSLCLFEGTVVSVGRGTDAPFQMYGAPFLKGEYTFVPKPTEGAKHPKLEGVTCNGKRFSADDLMQRRKQQQLNLSYLIEAYKASDDKDAFFNAFFKKLAGTDQLEQQIKSGKTEAQIRSLWESDLSQFKQIRSKYLLYN